MIDSKIINELIDVLKQTGIKTKSYDTIATVVRIEGDTAWVHIPGGVDETPVQMSINARDGDTVRIRVAGGQAWVVGNDSAPPTDDKMAEEAKVKAEQVADYVSTHMELTNDGLVITADSNQWEVLIKSDGVYIVSPEGRYVSQFTRFAQLGQSDAAHSIIDENGQRFYGSNGTTQLANIGYGEGASESGTSVAPYYTFGTRDEGAVGNYSFVEGRDNLATKSYAHAEGYGSSATGISSHAEGRRTEASGTYSHAEGLHSEATAEGAHAEGTASATGKYSHAESISYANGQRSHAEGGSTADGDYSHAEGYIADAIGDYSHAQNYGTNASSDYQTALGKFNEADDADTYAVIIGNGTSNNARSNALAVKWNGDVVLAANAKVDGVDVSELANDITTVNMASTTAVASGSNTTLCNTGSLSPGTYILNAMAIFPNQSGGYRRLFFSTTNTGSATTRFARTNVAPVSGADTEVQLTSMFTVSSATTYYLRAYQNSGSPISVATAGIQILKIHA